ncbi:MAG: sialate O-acetylesterase [Opitutaceae bacterium]|nr:sialate O-acetylesterase [Opitutaceae bacterium]
MRLPLLALLLLTPPVLTRADVTLAPLFQDHAVLQCDKPLPVWGRATAGERVIATFQGQVISTTAGADGRWIVYFEPLPASVEPAELVVSGKNTVLIKDVLVGEVWLASGQSNMEWPLAKSRDAAKEIAAAHYPLIRQFDVVNTSTEAPAATVAGDWQSCTPETAGRFSGVAYFFARDLHRKLGVPVGIINSTWGGTAIESWIDLATLKTTAPWPAIDARWQQALAEFPARAASYPAEQAAWRKAADEAAATKTKNLVPWPHPPVGPGTAYALGGLFNGMIAPLQPYALRGAIWYQGESNWPVANEYAGLFHAMIQAWRAQWNQGDFPFYFVQLPNYALPEDPTHRSWVVLREAQASALALPNTGMAVTLDVGEAKNLHPLNKQEVGRRLALIAKNRVYNIPGDWSGPVLATVQREGQALRVRFTHTGGGLIAERKPPQTLELSGADRKFYPASGKILGDSLLVSAPEVPEPVAVRYAWTNAPEANLYNGAGLPAAPFRSDNW